MPEQTSNMERALQLLRSEEEEERLAALRLIDRKTPESYKSVLFTAFGDSSWRVRKEATEIFLSFPKVENYIDDVVRFLYADENAGLRNTAVEVLIRLGRLSVPALIREVSSDDHDVRKFALDILGEIPDERSIPVMIEALKDHDSNVRAAAAENLGKLGAAEAVNPLLEAMATPDLLFRFTILEALGQIDATVPVDRLLEYSDDKLLRKALLDCLGRVGDAEAIPFLIRSLSDDMKNVREAALIALGQISLQARDFLGNVLEIRSDDNVSEAVSELLHEGGPDVQKAAISLLSCIGNRNSVSSLLELIENPELQEDTVAALVALGRIDPAPLLDAWAGAKGRARAYLAYIYGETGAAEAAERLQDSALAEDPELRQVSIQSLGKVADARALTVLTEALHDEIEEVRETAMQALTELGQRHRAETVSSLSPFLEHEDPEVRMYAVTVLGRLDGEDVEAHLAFAIKDESGHVRGAAIRAIDGKSGSAHLPALMLALTDEDSEVRALAAEALGMSGEEKAVDPLRLALQDEDMWVRSAAVRSLGRLCGPQAAPMIEPALMDPIGLVSITVLETLQELDIDNFSSYPIAALDHGDDEVIAAALKFLRSSGRDDWLDEVESRLVNHTHPDVRLTFARTLADITGFACCEKIEEMMLEEENEFVRQELQTLLVELKQDTP